MYKKNWILILVNTDIWRARRYTNTFRFIDDLATLNDGGEFERSFKEIKLYFKGIKIRANKFFIILCDRRDDFPFSIARMPHLCSNFPTKILCSTFGEESFRIARTTSVCNEFRTSSKALCNRAQKQGSNAVGF